MKKSLNDRIKEFCTYHIEGDGECNAILLKEYADIHNLDRNQRFDLCYFFSIVYCCESGIILLNNSDRIKNDPVGTAMVLKKDMIFQSDRKYMKMGDRFVKSLLFWSKDLKKDELNACIIDGVINLQKALKRVEKWYMFGRFSAFLFLETFATVMGYNVTNISIDWKNGDTATSGLLNLFGYDEYADYFDKKNVLTVPESKMDGLLNQLLLYVSESGGSTNVTQLETSLCAYRKFYKGTRYNGYYLDRMLEELNLYSKNNQQQSVTRELFDIRRKVFKHEFLGELHGWSGIRKENKTLYKEYGII